MVFGPGRASTETVPMNGLYTDIWAGISDIPVAFRPALLGTCVWLFEGKGECWAGSCQRQFLQGDTPRLDQATSLEKSAP